MDPIDPKYTHQYCSDHYAAYGDVLDGTPLTQSKAHTNGIECNNSQQRHGVAHFKRRSLAVSRSVEMVEVTMKLFAYFQQRKNLHKLKSLVR